MAIKTYGELAEEVLDVFRNYEASAYDTKRILKLARKMVDKTSVLTKAEENTRQANETR